MSIGYSQFPNWVTSNSSNSASNTANTQRTNENIKTAGRTSTGNLAAAADKKLNQTTASFMHEVFSTTKSTASTSSNSGETKIDKKNTLHLPAVVNIDGVTVRTNNRKDEDVIQELSQKTRKSTMMIESELKRKYTSRLSTSLDMNA